ncbi:MAG: glycosyltransferase family 39 protein [Planctomycetes bacterium]|nr:glycosyltransferase family 39 protein [Planctomycetota bacterium]
MEAAILITFSSLLSFWGLGEGPRLSDHEAIVAQGARQIRQGGEWLIPKVGDTPFVRKPPLGIWLAALASTLVDPVDVQPPVSPYAARLPSALASVLTCAIVYVLGRFMFGHRAGLIAGFVFASCAGTLIFSHNAQVDMVMTCLCTGAVACFWCATQIRPYRSAFVLVFYALLGLAMLAKAPFPLVVVCLPLAVWWFAIVPAVNRRKPLFRRLTLQFRRLYLLNVPTGVMLLLAIFLPWVLYVAGRVDHVWDLWRTEFRDRYTGDLSDEVKPGWYFVPLTFAYLLPFCLSLPQAVVSPFRQAFRPQRSGLLFVWSWVIVLVVFISTSPFKRPRYFTPALPAIALLLAPTLEQLFYGCRTISQKKLTVVIALIFAILIVASGGFAVYLQRNMPAFVVPYLTGVVVLLSLVGAASLAFFQRLRTLSFGLVLLTSTFAFTWTWGRIGSSTILNEPITTMVRELDARLIGQDDRLVYVAGRPDSQLMYYSGQSIAALISDLEMSALRRHRTDMPLQVLMEGLGRVERLLGHDTQEVYLLFTASWWDRFRAASPNLGREVFRVSSDRPGDAWVVVTNNWNTGEWEDILPASSERAAKRPESLPATGRRRSSAKPY